MSRALKDTVKSGITIWGCPIGLTFFFKNEDHDSIERFMMFIQRI